MHDLIKVKKQFIGRDEINAVDGRELHAFLGSKQDFSTWIKTRIGKYGFIEGVDFSTLHNSVEPPTQGLQMRIDYTLSIDMAKELSMVENNQQGRRARKYFIECEKKLNNPTFQIPQTMSEALRFAADQQDQIQHLEAQAEINRPKIQIGEKIEASTNAIQIGDYVKAISKERGFIIGRNNFYKWLRFVRILNSRNLPFQKYIDNGWFEVEERSYENENTNGPVASFTTKITGKGQIAILKRFQESAFSNRFLNKSARSNQREMEMA